MVESVFCIVYVYLTLLICGLQTSASDTGDPLKDVTLEPGHLKPFGSGRPSFDIEVVEGFPDASKFVKEYVHGSKPIKMKGAARLSSAFKMWTDDYFLSLELPEDSYVHLETVKKENREQDTVSMKFKEFIKIYNKTEHYMVDGVPEYLGQDVIFPCALQCPEILEKGVVALMMWFSSGGTKSVVHADAVDNINCLFRGEKTFIMVDVNKHRDKVDLDHPEGLYSSMDVDKVDFTKFPGLANVEYYHVNMTAGDCLYIPYRWIHQVRSYGSNLAVNVWWDHYLVMDVNPETCSATCDKSISLNRVNVNGMGSFGVNTVKDHIINIVAVKSLNKEGILQAFPGSSFIENIEDEVSRKKMASVFNELTDGFFKVLDLDGNGLITMDDLNTLPEEGWWDAHTFISEAEEMFRKLEGDGDKGEKELDQEEFEEEFLEGGAADFRDEL